MYNLASLQNMFDWGRGTREWKLASLQNVFDWDRGSREWKLGPTLEILLQITVHFSCSLFAYN
jgi:hypothetical protein